MDGIDTPFVYKLFESPRGERRRRRFDSALVAIWGTQESASEPRGVARVVSEDALPCRLVL